MIKMTVLMKRNPALTFEEFSAHHREVNAPLLASLSSIQQHVRRYVVSHKAPVDLPGLPPLEFDGYSELWFDDMAGLQAVFQDPEYHTKVSPDDARFLDLPGCRFLLTTEHVVIPDPTEPG